MNGGERIYTAHVGGWIVVQQPGMPTGERVRLIEPEPATSAPAGATLQRMVPRFSLDADAIAALERDEQMEGALRYIMGQAGIPDPADRVVEAVAAPQPKPRAGAFIGPEQIAECGE